MGEYLYDIVVLIPVRTFPFVTIEWALALRDLVIPGRFSIIVNYSPMPIDVVRRNLVIEALKLRPRYILFLDSDVVPPKDAIVKLIRHRYPVVSGVYVDKKGFWCVAIERDDGSWEYLRELPNKPFYADFVGLGCVLIESWVFEKMLELGIEWFKYTWDDVDNPSGYGEDFWFCKMVKRVIKGKILVDPEVKCRHNIVASLTEPNKATTQLTTEFKYEID